MNKKSMVWVTFQKEGIHCYPAANKDPKLATGSWDDVSFLAYPHRHIFHFKVWIEVFQNDRDIEFIQFKRWLEKLFNEETLKLDYKSCEMISDELYEKITTQYPNRDIRIDIAEDGENGAETYYTVSNKPEPQNEDLSSEKIKESVDQKDAESKHKDPNPLDGISFDGISVIGNINLKDILQKAKDDPSGLMQEIAEKFTSSIKGN